MKNAEANVRGTPEQIAEAHLILAIEKLGDKFPGMAERCMLMLQDETAQEMNELYAYSAICRKGETP